MSGARSAWSPSCGANHEATPLWVSHIRAATTALGTTSAGTASSGQVSATTARTPAAANPRPCMG